MFPRPEDSIVYYKYIFEFSNAEGFDFYYI